MMMDEPSENMTSLKAKVNLDPSMYYNDDIALLQDLLDQLSLVIKTKNIPKEPAMSANLGLKVANVPLLNVEFIQTKDQMGLKVPLIDDKYFYLNLDEYGSFMRKIDPFYVGPETLEIPSITWSDLKLSDKEKEKLTKNFKKFLNDNLHEDYFTMEKGIKYENGESVRKIQLELSPSETEKFLRNFINYLNEDKSWQEIIQKRLNLLLKAVGQDYGLEEEEIEELYSAYGITFFFDIDESAMEFPEGFTYTIYVDQDKMILERDIRFVISDVEESSSVEFALATKAFSVEKEKERKEFSLELVTKDEYYPGKLEFHYGNDIHYEKDSRREALAIDFLEEEDEWILVQGEFSLKSTYQGKNANKQSIARNYELTLNSDDLYDPIQLSGVFHEDRDISVKNKYANFIYDISVLVDDGFEKFGLGFDVESKTEFKDLNFPTIGASNGMNVNTLTEADLLDLIEEIESRIGDLLYSFGMFDF